MESSAKLLDLPARTAARALCLDYLGQAREARRRINDAGDDTALHDFRVALRRLRSCARAYAPYLDSSIDARDRRRLRRLTRATNHGRDLEVRLAWLENVEVSTADEAAAQSWLIARTKDTRLDTDVVLRRLLRRDFRRERRRLTRRLSGYRVNVEADSFRREPTCAEALGELVRSAGDSLAARLDELAGDGRIDPQHRARIAAKRLRYLLEPHRDSLDGARSSVEALRRLQDLLGDIRDIDLLIGSIEHELSSPDDFANLPGVADGLRSLRGKLSERRTSLFAELQNDWVPVPQPLIDPLARVIVAIEERTPAPREIERKYLLSGMPPVDEATGFDVDQGWLPGRRIRERLRRVAAEDATHFFRTIKLGTGASRVEIEEEISGELFDALWLLTEGKRVRKRRYRVPHEDAVWEIDRFTDRELVLAEIELESESDTVEPPEWLVPHIVREVTGEAEYLNYNLAR